MRHLVGGAASSAAVADGAGTGGLPAGGTVVDDVGSDTTLTAGTLREVSIPVELEALAGEVAASGAVALLVTVNEDDRPHAVAVEVTWDDGRLRAGAGSRTAGNVGRRPGVSLVWPTLVPGEYSLIVDGRATVVGEAVLVAPERAVRHRTPVGASGADPDAPSCITVLQT